MGAASPQRRNPSSGTVSSRPVPCLTGSQISAEACRSAPAGTEPNYRSACPITTKLLLHMPIRLVLADDHPIVLEGLQGLLKPPEFEILAMAQDGRQCVDAVLALEPDVLVLDHQMPRMTGLQVLAALRERPVRTLPVMLTGTLEDSRVLEAIQLGARGIVPKELAARHLIQCIKTVAEGGTWVETELLRRAMQATPREALLALLTPREREIVRQVTAGRRNKEIARKMSISEGTVKMHLHNIYSKLNVASRTELAVFANSLRPDDAKGR